MSAVALSCTSDGDGGSAADVDEFVRAVTDWERLAPPGDSGRSTVGAPSEESAVGSDGQAYVCQVQTYSLTQTPREVVLADPNAGQIWPGAILDGAAHVLGSLRPIAVDGSNRGPLGLSVAGGGVLGIRSGVSTVVDQPVGSTVREGINQLIANALDSEVVAGAGFSSFESVESYSAEQAVLELGLSARYLGNSVNAELSYAHAANEHTYTAYFIQRLYTIAIDPPESPAGFFSSEVTADQLAELGLSEDSPPLYISSVSYGRILMYSLTSSASREAIEGAIEYSYNALAGSVDAEAAARYEQVLSDASIEVLAVGGPNTGVQNLIRTGNLAAYFEEDLALNQVEPIAFTVNRLSDNQVAEVVDATEYEVRNCELVGADLPQPDYWWPLDGSLEEVVFGADLGGVVEEYTAGRYGQAFPFDGSVGSANTFGRVGDVDVSKIVPTDSGFTVAAWINPRTQDLGTIISQVGGGFETGDFAVRVGSGSGGNARLFFYRRPSGESASVDNQMTDAIVPLNEWTHIVAVYGVADPAAETTSMRLYVNGMLATDVVTVSRYDGVRGDVLTRIGTSELAPQADGPTQHQYPFNGSLDELMLFTRPLSADEVAVMYQNFSSYKES